MRYIFSIQYATLIRVTLLQSICYLIFLLQPFVLQTVEMEVHACHQTSVLVRRRTLALYVKNVGFIELFS